MGAMPTFRSSEPPRGIITLEPVSLLLVHALFRPSKHALAALRLAEGKTVKPVRLLEFDKAESRLTIRPIQTRLSSDYFCTPKYAQIQTINVPMSGSLALPEDLDDVTGALLELPRGFTTDLQYGLGLPMAYRPIIEAIERQTKCNEIYIAEDGPTSIDGKRFTVSITDFETIRQQMDRIVSRGNTASLRVRQTEAYNWLTEYTDEKPIAYKRARHPMIQAFADAASETLPLDDETLDELLSTVETVSRQMPKNSPQSLAKLRADVEFVELDILLIRYSNMLESGLGEKEWQAFFEENPFILSLGLGHPVVMVESQAAIGGRKFSRTGDKITDFLTKNPSTDNVAIFEIKHPGSKLVDTTEYRGELFAPGRELVGSVTQALDQRYKLQYSMTTLQKASRIYDLESYSVRVCVVIGTTPAEPDEVKSFEIFRNTLRDVDVVTFDELYHRLQQLRQLMKGDAPDG
jgi:hypothetical protein